MTNFKKCVILSLLTILSVACSSDTKGITDDQIIAATEGKQLLSIDLYSSDDLEYNFPASMTICYVEDGIVYSQSLYPDGLRERKVEEYIDASDYHAPLDYDTLVGNFDFRTIWTKATAWIDDISDDALEYYRVRSLGFDVPKKIFGDMRTRDITIQATKKGERVSTEMSDKGIQRTQKYYEFSFKILDNLEIEYIEL